MSAQDVSFKRKEDETSTVVQYDFGDDMAAAIEKFGEEVIWSRAKSAMVIDLQAYGRRLLEKKADPKNTETVDIPALIAAWRPDVRSVVRQTAAEKAATAIASMSPEEKAKLLASLQASLG